MTSSPALLEDEMKYNKEEEIPFCTLSPPQGPDKGQEGASGSHAASEAQRARAASFKSAFSLEWRCHCWASVSLLLHTSCFLPLAERALRTASRTSCPLENDVSSCCSLITQRALMCPKEHHSLPWLLSRQVPLENAGILSQGDSGIS